MFMSFTTFSFGSCENDENGVSNGKCIKIASRGWHVTCKYQTLVITSTQIIIKTLFVSNLLYVLAQMLQNNIYHKYILWLEIRESLWRSLIGSTGELSIPINYYSR